MLGTLAVCWQLNLYRQQLFAVRADQGLAAPGFPYASLMKNSDNKHKKRKKNSKISLVFAGVTAPRVVLTPWFVRTPPPFLFCFLDWHTHVLSLALTISTLHDGNNNKTEILLFCCCMAVIVKMNEWTQTKKHSLCFQFYLARINFGVAYVFCPYRHLALLLYVKKVYTSCSSGYLELQAALL